MLKSSASLSIPVNVNIIISRRYLSDSIKNSKSPKRFMQTVPLATNSVSYILFKSDIQVRTQSQQPSQPQQPWKGHTLPARSFKDIVRKKTAEAPSAEKSVAAKPPVETAAETPTSTPVKRVKRRLRPRRALITLAPNAITHLKALLNQPEPKMIRIGVKNRGCSGLTYNLEYISEPKKFDEIVEQDGVKVVIDSKALFSIVGSEMDWLDDKISSRFIFRNPNSKGTCGCGESFMV